MPPRIRRHSIERCVKVVLKRYSRAARFRKYEVAACRRIGRYSVGKNFGGHAHFEGLVLEAGVEIGLIMNEASEISSSMEFGTILT